MNALIATVYSLAAANSLVGAAEKSYLEQRISASQQIQAGATKDRVRALLGAPTGEWETTGFLFVSGPPQWCYGTVFEPRYIILADALLPNPLPINIRIFGPSERDLVITWDKSGQVAEVKRP